MYMYNIIYTIIGILSKYYAGVNGAYRNLPDIYLSRFVHGAPEKRMPETYLSRPRSDTSRLTEYHIAC